MSDGLLLCSDATASLLVSYILQGKKQVLYFVFSLKEVIFELKKFNFKNKAEFGDHADNANNQINYFKEKRYFPHQTEEHETKITEYYKNHT